MKYHWVGRCQMMVCQSSSLFSVRIGCCVWQSVRPPTAGSPFTFNNLRSHIGKPVRFAPHFWHSLDWGRTLWCIWIEFVLTRKAVKSMSRAYEGSEMVAQQSLQIVRCLKFFSREWYRTRLPQDKQGINRNIRPGSIMEQERVSWDVGMRLLARWYKVLLPHLTSYEECPFTSWVLGKILRSHLWLNQGVCFLWNLHDFWVNSHHIVTHFLTDFPVSWLTPLEGECLSLNSVAPWFWSTCRINMASRLSLKCLSATCCLQLST